MRRPRWAILGLAAAIVIVGVVLWLAWSLRPARLKDHAVSVLAEHLGLDVTLEELSFSVWPGTGISGRGLVIRVPGHPDIPPFVSVDRFTVEGGVRSVLAGHFRAAHLEGLKVTLPPGDTKREISNGGKGGHDSNGSASRVIIDLIDTPNAEFAILRRKPGDPALVFQIHELTLKDAGFNRQVPFHAKLTNPIPRGLVDSTGHVGPFPKGQPAELPISGDYSFTAADLNTIRGIGGILSSTGRYDGVLSRLAVEGRSETPDFTLDLGGKPQPLTATFRTVVDGTDGSVRLEQVDARLLNTDMHVTGMLDNLPGPGNRDIKLDARVIKGRIEDLLQLIADSPTRVLSGEVTLQAAVALPPGPKPKRQRLHITGRFELAAAHFDQPQIQAKVVELSRRGQGKAADDGPVNVFSNVRSRFEIHHGMLTVRDLTFEVPGAVIAMNGNYNTITGALDLEGEARLEAPLSKVVGGWKSVFVRPFDSAFKRSGAGTVIPIAVSGTRSSPQLRIRFGAMLKRAAGGS